MVVMFRSVYKTRYHLLPRQARVGAIDCARKTQTQAGCYTAITMRSEKCGLNGFSNNGCLWNGMTAPFINYTIFGALWYQGNNYDAHFIAFYRICSHLPAVCPSLNYSLSLVRCVDVCSTVNNLTACFVLGVCLHCGCIQARTMSTSASVRVYGRVTMADRPRAEMLSMRRCRTENAYPLSHSIPKTIIVTKTGPAQT